MTDPFPRRAEVWLARLDKVRPIVVLTRDPLGALLHAVIAAPVTSTIRGLSTEVPIGPASGIRLESVVNLDNVQLVGRSRLVKRGGARLARYHDGHLSGALDCCRVRRVAPDDTASIRVCSGGAPLPSPPLS